MERNLISKSTGKILPVGKTVSLLHNPPRDTHGRSLMDQKLNILLLEDVSSDAALVVHELSRSGLHFSWQRVDTREEFLEELSRFAPHVILADYSLPQFTAIDALRLLKERGVDVPLILVTGSNSDEVAVECLREGADDYILKEALRRLPTAVV